MKDWKISEAVKVLKEGKDKEAIKEITSASQLLVIASLEAFMSDKLGLEGDKSDKEKAQETRDEAVEKADKKKLEDMSNKELAALCKEKGINVPTAGRNKQFYIDKLKGVESESEEQEDWGEEKEEEKANPYEGKSAKELFLMCKDRGIKVEVRKPEKYYVDILTKSDEDMKEPEEDDWGEEAENKKPAAKGNGKKEKKESKPVVAEDDDWEI